MYIYICVCIHTHTHTHIYIYIYIYIFISPAESLCCPPKTITTLLLAVLQYKIKSKEKKYVYNKIMSNNDKNCEEKCSKAR